MKKLADLIVKYSKIILILFIPLMVYCGLSINKVNIEYSITAYLPSDTDTKQALDIMDEEFVTYGTSTILIRNITYSDASKLAEDIRNIDGVKELPFENTVDYYKSSSALFTITYDGTEDDAICKNAYYQVIEKVSNYDALVASSLVDTYADDLKNDINRILILVICVIVVVLAFTSRSFAEVFVYLMIFGVSALLNMGTNYWFGTISFISNSVCVILQLALAIDYAIILSHRFAEEKEYIPGNPKEAMSIALSKAIPEIFGSSLTTIAGLLALCCMTLKLGADLGLVLAKSIMCSIFTVFLLMPSLMLLFTKAIDKTTHKSFVPNITWFGKSVMALKHVLPVIFVGLVAVGAYFSFQVTYVYSQSSIDTSKPTEAMVANEQIKEIFGSKNQFVVLVPKGDYSEEEKVIEYLEGEQLIDNIVGISNVDITMNNYTYTLVDQINYKDFAAFLGMDEDTSKQIFYAYAYLSQDNSTDGLEEVMVFTANPDIYRITLLDIADCAFKYDDFITAYLYDNDDVLDNYYDIKEQIQDAEDQLIGTNYSRVVCNINSEIESKETFALIERLNTNLKSECPGIILAGDSMSSYDLNSSFSTDNLMISILTIVFVYLILMFTTSSWGIPILQVATIQGAIFINFAIPALMGTNIFFFVYLIVSSIQMGATIDYAIVITNRYQELVEKEDRKQAVIDTLNQSFPTIVTSGTIMIVAGFAIYFLVGDPLISTLGLALGRGTIISILCVMCILPTFLYFFENILKKCKLPSFNIKKVNLKEVNKKIKEQFYVEE